METPWIEDAQLSRALLHNEAFWRGELEDHPLVWITVPEARPGRAITKPATEGELWTNVDYVLEAAEDRLSRSRYLGDALPVFTPWLGPDQFAAWLGADLVLKPAEYNTSWVTPFVQDWANHPEFHIDPQNRWWMLYLETVRRSAEQGRGKWITGYPDLHTGIDALSAIRGAENLNMDLIADPDSIRRAMRQMTDLWKSVIDTVSDIVLPAGQGTSNWTLGWSADRFLCIGQNDFSCMISPGMFREFCWEDNYECCDHADWSMYHLDGPGAVRHLTLLFEIQKLHCIQWIPGAGAPPPSRWLDLLRRIQQAGKTVQVWPLLNCTEDTLCDETEILCSALDPARLFINVDVTSVDLAEEILKIVRRVCKERRPVRLAHPPRSSLRD